MTMRSPHRRTGLPPTGIGLRPEHRAEVMANRPGIGFYKYERTAPSGGTDVFDA